jgi:hypothetical protein
MKAMLEILTRIANLLEAILVELREQRGGRLQ